MANHSAKVILILSACGIGLLLAGAVFLTSGAGEEVQKEESVQGDREGFIPVPGGNIWYRIVGADAPGTPLLVLHGGPGASSDYLEPLKALADERPVIFYDQLGGGNSDRPGDPSLWTVNRSVAEIDAVCTALDLDRVHILGQSWGTALAVEYTLTAGRDRARSLVLSAPCLSAGRWAADQQAHIADLPEDVRAAIREGEASGDFASPEYQEAMMVFYNRHVCRLEPWPDCLNRTFEKLGFPVYERMWGPSEFTVTGTLRDYDCTPRLGGIAVPVLFTCGEHDEASPVTTAYYAGLVPGAKIAVFPDASHEHHLEKSEEYLKTVREFLRLAESGER
ncbi:alpha/beta fold hydrolase [Methanoculleus sp. FWC-SCC1]|uniref:Proline iminopeptidase n=1 Tax=Methanoculleus frigidifontis TaxID=2584085 RepID=A0ABT8M9W2_9EURY|nr:proline iminopeptidase-family hydrolase [Methanoculleus sp. FWC-SCC1]MDN7024723.1 alpha/beta fold hydrolase [Methanoculleus sp. FWC-SCC1]